MDRFKLFQVSVRTVEFQQKVLDSSFGSFKMLPAVLVLPLGPANRFEQFQFPIPARLVGHPECTLSGSTACSYYMVGFISNSPPDKQNMLL